MEGFGSRPPHQAERPYVLDGCGRARYHGQSRRADSNVTQPSISKSVADLEHQLRRELLTHSARLETTRIRQRAADASMGAFDELRQGIKDIETLSDPAIGEVRFGFQRPRSRLSGRGDSTSSPEAYPRAIIQTVEPSRSRQCRIRTAARPTRRHPGWSDF